MLNNSPIITYGEVCGRAEGSRGIAELVRNAPSSSMCFDENGLSAFERQRDGKINLGILKPFWYELKTPSSLVVPDREPPAYYTQKAKRVA